MKRWVPVLLTCSLATAGLNGATVAVAEPAVQMPIAQAVADFSTRDCYSIAAGTTAQPADNDPDLVAKSQKLIEGMGLAYGLAQSIYGRLGPAGTALVSRATMGSTSIGSSDIILTFGGPQPGCRVILLAEPDPALPPAVRTALAASGWKPVSDKPTVQGPAERWLFVRRDAAGRPFLMNLIVFTALVPNTGVRLFTTTIAIPPNVQLPPGQ